MVGVAQLVEHRVVVPVAAGSSPVIHPMFEASTDVERETTTRSGISSDVPWQTVVWNDPAIGIRWPIANPVVSAKDAAGVPLSQAECFA